MPNGLAKFEEKLLLAKQGYEVVNNTTGGKYKHG